MTIVWCIAIAWLVCVVVGVGWLWWAATHAPMLPYPDTVMSGGSSWPSSRAQDARHACSPLISRL
jgi:hypothetical protein